MRTRVSISLSLKVTLIVIVTLAASILSVSYVNIYYQAEDYAGAYYLSGFALTQNLNTSINNSEILHNREILLSKMNDLINHSYNEVNKIRKITVNLPDENNELIVFASTDADLIGKKSDPYFRNGIYCNEKCFKNDETYYIHDPSETDPQLLVLSPINLTGEIEGTYEMIISMSDAYQALQKRMNLIYFISVILLFISIFATLFLLRKLIVKPIITLKDKAKIIGKGNLDTKVEINKRDELGELANAFNQMARDLKESRDKIQEYNRILENLLNQKDEFIGQLGHDLKNPLQPLVGLLPMLIEQEKDPKTKETLQLMNKNVEYMRDLIFDTLELAKLRSADIKFDVQDLNLRTEAEDVIESQKLFFKDHGIDVENKIDKEIVVQADKLRLSEVLKNLLTNSVKYTPEKKGKITVDAEQEKEWVTVSITDNGIGMTKDQLKKVFDEFYKADRVSSDYYSTGLGLSICKRIIDKHGGKIWVESPGPGKGSSFYFTLKAGKFKNSEK